MAKTARLLTAEDELDELDLEDDFDEPMMQGIDEFHDYDLDDEDEDENESEHTSPPHQAS